VTAGHRGKERKSKKKSPKIGETIPMMTRTSNDGGYKNVSNLELYNK